MILLLLSFVRTVVPAIVGAVVGYLVSLGITLDPEFEGAMTAVMFALFTGIYYLLVRVVEMRFPAVGVLLGWAKSPDSYSRGTGVDVVSKSQNEVTIQTSDRVDGPDHRA